MLCTAGQSHFLEFFLNSKESLFHPAISYSRFQGPTPNSSSPSSIQCGVKPQHSPTIPTSRQSAVLILCPSPTSIPTQCLLSPPSQPSPTQTYLLFPDPRPGTARCKDLESITCSHTNTCPGLHTSHHCLSPPFPGFPKDA